MVVSLVPDIKIFFQKQAPKKKTSNCFVGNWFACFNSTRVMSRSSSQTSKQKERKKKTFTKQPKKMLLLIIIIIIFKIRIWLVWFVFFSLVSKPFIFLTSFSKILVQASFPPAKPNAKWKMIYLNFSFLISLMYLLSPEIKSIVSQREIISIEKGHHNTNVQNCNG